MTIVFVLVFILVWSMPGAYVARGIYSERVREFRTTPIPKSISNPKPRPPRPKIAMNEMLHDSSAHKTCALLRKGTEKRIACNCSYRQEWIENKNAWYEYNNWEPEAAPKDDPEPPKVPVLAVPFWPAYLALRFITAGAKNIPDYRYIERLDELHFPDTKEL